jgi:hypothetical protein
VILRGDRCLCRTCGEYFNSTRAFDKHRFGDWGMRRCRTPDVMEALGMSKNAKGFWITSKHSDSAIAQRRSSRVKADPLG